MDLETYLRLRQVPFKNTVQEQLVNDILKEAPRILNCPRTSMNQYRVYRNIDIYGSNGNNVADLVFYAPSDIVVVLAAEALHKDKRIRRNLGDQLEGFYYRLYRQFKCSVRKIGVYRPPHTNHLEWFELPRPLDHLLPRAMNA